MRAFVCDRCKAIDLSTSMFYKKVQVYNEKGHLDTEYEVCAKCFEDIEWSFKDPAMVGERKH